MADARDGSTKRSWVAVGSLTRATPYFEKANGAGISLLLLDEEGSGELTLVSQIAGIDNPTYLAVDSEASLLFATSEVFGWNEGTVSAYRIEGTTGRLSYINKQVTRGSLTAHLSVDHSRHFLFATNYAHETPGEAPGQAMAVFGIQSDGSLTSAISTVAHVGSGRDRERQGVPHPHSTLSSPVNDVVSVADLGTDSILHYAFCPSSGLLESTPFATTALPPGAGPRHFVHSPDGRHLFVLNELSSTLSAFRWSGRAKTDFVMALSTLPSDFIGDNLCADLQISADGRFLYGSNRGHDSIACFEVDAESGSLTALGQIASQGRTPRSFAIAPGGKHLIVANQNSDNLVVMHINPSDGRLIPAASVVPLGSPMCVKAFRL
jgi:6-phosphogluconolactonase